MMLWDYGCISCEHVFEELTKLDEANPNCPLCQSQTIKILLNNPTQESDPKMAELSIKFRKSIKKYQNSSKESRPTLDSGVSHR